MVHLVTRLEMEIRSGVSEDEAGVHAFLLDLCVCCSENNDFVRFSWMVLVDSAPGGVFFAEGRVM